jgi:hypothetical protein
MEAAWTLEEERALEAAWEAVAAQLPPAVLLTIDNLRQDVHDVRRPEHVHWLADKVIRTLLGKEYATWRALYIGWDEGTDPLE